MSADFKLAFWYVFKDEGGFVNNPHDKGGPTKYGVTLRTLASWLAPKTVTIEDVQNLTIEEAQALYYSRYWLVSGCDRVEAQAVAVALFDVAVWAGPHTATLYAQMALNVCLEASGVSARRITEDGYVGPSTITALSRVSPEAFLKTFHGLLLVRTAGIIKADPTQKVFELGWTHRVDRLLTLIPSDTTAKVS